MMDGFRFSQQSAGSADDFGQDNGSSGFLVSSLAMKDTLKESEVREGISLQRPKGKPRKSKVKSRRSIGLLHRHHHKRKTPTLIKVIKEEDLGAKIQADWKVVRAEINANTRRILFKKVMTSEVEDLEKGHNTMSDWGSPQKNIDISSPLAQITYAEEWIEAGWLHKRNKGPTRSDRRAQFKKRQHWFECLDTDSSGGVGADDLLEPLLTMGLAKSRADVDTMFELVATSESGEINFTEFLAVLKQGKMLNSHEETPVNRESVQRGKSISRSSATAGAGGRANARARLANLFRKLSDSSSGEKELSFPTLIVTHRRRVLLNANMAPKNSEEYKEGTSVLAALVAHNIPGNTPVIISTPVSNKFCSGKLTSIGPQKPVAASLRPRPSIVRKTQFKLRKRAVEK